MTALLPTQRRRHPWVAAPLLILVVAAVASGQDTLPRVDQHGDLLPPFAVARLGTLRWRSHGCTELVDLGAGRVLSSGIASTREGREIYIDDVSMGKRLHTWSIADMVSPDEHLTWSADRNTLAFDDGQGSVRILDVRSETIKASWHAPRSFRIYALSPDGKTCALMDPGRGKLRLVDAVTGLERWVVPGLARAAAFTSDGQSLLVANEKQVVVWDVQQRTKRRRLAGGASDLAMSADGRVLATLNARTVQLWDLPSGTRQRRLELPGWADERCRGIAVSAHGQTVAFVDTKALIAWDASAGTIQFETIHAATSPALALAPDGKTICWPDGEALRRWDVVAGRELTSANAHRYGVNALEFSRDGRKLLASAAADVYLWELAHQPPRARVLYEQNEIVPRYASGIAMDGTRVAIPEVHGLMQVLNAESGEPIRVLWRYEADWRRLRFTSDDKFIVGTGAYPGVRLWDANTGWKVRDLPCPDGCRALAVTPDARRLVTCGDAAIRLWDPAGKQTQRITSLGNDHIAVSPAGNRVYAAGAQIRVYDLDQDTFETWPNSDATIEALALSPDGALLATSSGDIIRLWDVREKRPVCTLAGHAQAVDALAFTPDGKRLASGSRDTTILFWDVVAALRAERSPRRAGNLVQAWPTSGPPIPRLEGDTDPLPDGALARLGTTRLQHSAAIQALCFFPDDRRVAACSTDGLTRVWDIGTGQLAYQVGAVLPQTRPEATISPDGNLLAVTAPRGGVLLVNAETGKTQRRLDLEPCDPLENVATARFSTDGKRLAVLQKGSAVFLCDLPSRPRLAVSAHADERFVALSTTGEQVVALDGKRGATLVEVRTGKISARVPADNAGPVALSPDGKLLATRNPHGQGIDIWRTTTGRRVATLPDVAAVCAWAPDGKTLALAGGNGEHVRLWDLATRQRLRLLYHPACVTALAFSGDGQLLGSGDEAGSVRVWDVATGNPCSPSHDFNAGAPLRFSDAGHTLLVRSRLGLHQFSLAPAAALRGHVAVREASRIAIPDLVGVAPDGKTAVSRSGNGLYLWDLAHATERRQILESDNVSHLADGLGHVAVAFTHDSRALLTTAPDRAVLLDGTTDRRESFLATDLTSLKWSNTHRRLRSTAGCGMPSIAFLPDDQAFITADTREGITLNIWDRGTGSARRRFDVPGSPTTATIARTQLALAPKGRVLALASEMHGFWVLEIASGRVLFSSLQNASPSDWAPAVAFSPDGRLLATTPPGAPRIQLWEMASGQRLAELAGHTGPVHSLVFSPDSRLLASGSADNTVLLWDTRLAALAKPTAKPAAADWDRHWQELAGADLARVRAALVAFATYPNEGAAFLRSHLQPVAPIPAAKLAKLVADLDADDYASRQGAFTELKAMGAQVHDALRRALPHAPSLEARLRLEQLLATMPDGLRPLPPSAPLRDLRAIWALEHMDCTAAPALLQRMSKGDPLATATQAARAALQRLNPRAPSFSGGS